MRERREVSGRPADGRAELARYSTLGISWVLTVVLFAGGGLLLDQRLGTSPLLALAGALLGIVGGFYSLYVRLVAKPENTRERKGRAGAGGPKGQPDGPAGGRRRIRHSD